jgi:hypothetical protein
LFVLGKEKGAELLESLQAEGVRGEIVTEENL